MQRRYVMLDRDGTIIIQKHYLSDPDEVELIPGVGAALCILNEIGLGLVVLTNQSPISRGLFDETRLEMIHKRMAELLANENVYLDAIYYCPHIPEDGCNCRKPNTGLAERAAQELSFNLKESYMIGDKLCDIEMGRRVGAATFLVRTGYGDEEERYSSATADYVVADLLEAAQVIKRLTSAKPEENLHAKGS